MQSLYEWDFRGHPTEELPEIVEHVKAEFAPGFDDDYIEKQVEGIISKLKDVDEAITHFAPEWPMSEMTSTDRNVLRVGAYELLFDENIPSKVAINEAIELGKTFGGEASGKFVNGVLGAVYKNQIAKGITKEVDLKKEKKEKSSVEVNEEVSEPMKGGKLSLDAVVEQTIEEEPSETQE